MKFWKKLLIGLLTCVLLGASVIAWVTLRPYPPKFPNSVPAGQAFVTATKAHYRISPNSVEAAFNAMKLASWHPVFYSFTNGQMVVKLDTYGAVTLFDSGLVIVCDPDGCHENRTKALADLLLWLFRPKEN